MEELLKSQELSLNNEKALFEQREQIKEFNKLNNIKT